SAEGLLNILVTFTSLSEAISLPVGNKMAPVLGLAAVTGHFFKLLKLFSTNLLFSTLLLSAII
uniref:Uncharacterized protein n=1 Tax=Nothobranchius furzeri TaxID=105023 RepID=A0A8C6LGW1_NOTFU